MNSPDLLTFVIREESPEQSNVRSEQMVLTLTPGGGTRYISWWGGAARPLMP